MFTRQKSSIAIGCVARWGIAFSFFLSVTCKSPTLLKCSTKSLEYLFQLHHAIIAPFHVCIINKQSKKKGVRKKETWWKHGQSTVQYVLDAVSWLCWFFQVPCLTLPVSRDPTGEEGNAGWSQQPHRRPPDGTFITIMDLRLPSHITFTFTKAAWWLSG